MQYHGRDPATFRIEAVITSHLVYTPCKVGVPWLQAYTASKESPDIISAELGGVSGVATSDVADTAEFRMRASLASREAVAILCIEESSTLEMVIKLPASWPLRSAEVECRRRVSTLRYPFPIKQLFRDPQSLSLHT